MFLVEKSSIFGSKVKRFFVPSEVKRILRWRKKSPRSTRRETAANPPTNHHTMSPLSNTSNNNNNHTNSSTSLTSSTNSANHTSSSAFKPLVSENRQLNMLSTSVASANPVDPYGSELSAYGSAYHHHHHLNTQLSGADYLNVHHQSLPLGVYKGDHDDLQSGYSFARPVKLYEHNAVSVASSAASACGGKITNSLYPRRVRLPATIQPKNLLNMFACGFSCVLLSNRCVDRNRNHQFGVFVIKFECISWRCTVAGCIDHRFIDIERDIAAEWRWRGRIYQRLVLRWPAI